VAKISVFRAKRLVTTRMAMSAQNLTALRPLLVRRFEKQLRRLHDAIAETDLDGRYWMWGGLLLGWAREGAILPHDCVDADFAVADEDFGHLMSAVPSIMKAGFRCDRRFMNNEGDITEVTFIRYGSRFEFFRMFPAGERLKYFMYSKTWSDATELEAYLPAQRRVPFSFIGRTWLKHEDHARELESIYGSWQIPDPGWSYLDGPDIEVRREWHMTDFDWRYRGPEPVRTTGPAVLQRGQ
jgi:hypothetical protein